MKPYGATTENYGDTGCCPGHDKPFIKKWSGMYSSNRSRRGCKKHVKAQNRRRRHKDKATLSQSGINHDPT